MDLKMRSNETFSPFVLPRKVFTSVEVPGIFYQGRPIGGLHLLGWALSHNNDAIEETGEQTNLSPLLLSYTYEYIYKCYYKFIYKCLPT